jgi:AAA family ATP:ADP antiporter
MPHSNDQRAAARIATVSAVIVIASFVAGKAARDAILLARFDIKSLPWFIAISAVVSFPIIVVAGKLMARFGPARLMPVVNLVSAALAAGEWLLIPRYPRPIAVAAYFHFATSGAVLVSGFWSIVNERFDVQSAKRHISRIGIGATLGGIFGGVIAERCAVYLAPDAILLVLAALQLACAVTLYLFGGGAYGEPAVDKPVGTWVAFREAMGSPLLRSLGGIVVLGAVAAGIMDYVFKADIVASGAASGHDGLLRSLAIFYTVTSVITAIVQAVVCGPLIARLGVARGLSTLPLAVTAFGLAAVAIRVPLAAAIARGAEVVTRNSIYRAGYELIYAPLPEDRKRPAKVVLDVGADRLGDLLGAQLVALLVFAMAEPRTGLLVAVAVTGSISLAVAMRLPGRYTRSLEDSLLAHASDAAPVAGDAAGEAPPWVMHDGVPSLGQAGELGPLSLRFRQRAAGKRGRGSAAAPSAHAPLDRVLAAVSALRSGDAGRIQRALADGLTCELAPYAIDLVGRDDVARAALAALGALAPSCTGLLVDALLDPARDVAVRRRLPSVLLAAEPALAAWGLWRALRDPSFDVRYRAGAVLAQLAAAGHLRGISQDDVFEAVRHELLADHGAAAAERIIDDIAEDPVARDDGAAPGQRASLEHVFTVLGLALPAEPLRIALHAVQTDDPELRGTALEYLESILPSDVRAQLWPLLEGEAASLAAAAVGPGDAPAGDAALPPAAQIAAPLPIGQTSCPRADHASRRTPRSPDEIVAALRVSYPTVLEKLRQRIKAA